MPILAPQQYADVGAQWTAFAQALSTYANTRQNDTGYDANQLAAWMANAAAYANNFSAAAMTADFADADAAYQQLKGALSQANTYITQLQNAATNWGNLTGVVNAGLALAQIASGGAATAILAAAQGLSGAAT
jgi:hypothetical protein